MSDPLAFQEYEAELRAIVTAPNVTEAQAALVRSGQIAGVVIGETLIESTEILDYDG